MRLVILSLALTTGCVLPLAGSADDDPSSPTSPTSPTSPPPVASGPYQVRSNIEITVEALLPEPAADLVATLRDFSDNPAHTLITLADEAGVPAVGTLRAVLPSFLEDRLEGWLDDEINKLTFDGLSIPQLAAAVVALAETSLSQVDVESELTISAGAATHRLVALDLAPSGLDARLELGALPGEITTALPRVTTTGSTLSIADHQFSVAYGAYAWQAIETATLAAHGGDVRATIGAAVNCPLIASRVATKCLLGVCVGHATELTALCERGLDEVVDGARARLTAVRFDALRFAAGTATMVDANRDRLAEQLTDGVWTAEINAGLGLRPAPATFTATR